MATANVLLTRAFTVRTASIFTVSWHARLARL